MVMDNSCCVGVPGPVLCLGLEEGISTVHQTIEVAKGAIWSSSTSLQLCCS